jgi:putative ABC transport system permease protein
VVEQVRNGLDDDILFGNRGEGLHRRAAEHTQRRETDWAREEGFLPALSKEEELSAVLPVYCINVYTGDVRGVSEMVRETREALIALRETFWIAMDTLRAHKLRSFLTLLGVILAVTTLIAVISVLNGLNVYVAEKVANLGANAFVVDRIGIVTNFQDWNRARRRPPLNMEDYDALRHDMKLAENVAGEQNTTADVRYANVLSEDVMILGATANYSTIRELEIARGRLLTDADENHRANICIIGPDVANKLFPGIDPIGRQIRAGQLQYQVVGVTAARGTVLGESQDNFVMMPLSTYRKAWLVPQDSVTLFIEARSPEWMPAAEDEARVILRARRHVPYEKEDNFGVIAPSSLMSLWQRITGSAFSIAVWITSVFLVVGGIVIMNIMLASVTERTREIGLRKSLGARRRHIVMQFLVESSLLAAVGGSVGVLVAVAITQLVRATTPMPISTPITAILISLTLSTAVGLFFGIYPAMRAARLDPIEALRAEV